MKKKILFLQILGYMFVPILFISIVYKINKIEYTDDADGDVEIISEIISQIPNSVGSINKFEYESFIINEEISIVDLALKLKKDVKLLQYNNPEIIRNPILYPGKRLVIYKEPIIFYRVKEGDTLTEISSKFRVSKETIINFNPNINGENINNVKYIIIKNPIINDNIIAERGMEGVEGLVDLSGKFVREINSEVVNTNNILNTTKIIKNNSSSSNTRKSYNKIEKIQENFRPDIKETEHLQETYEENDELYWPVLSTKITSEFGERIHPISGKRNNHTGIDISSIKGAAVSSGVSGIVTYAGQKGGYGNIIEVKRSDGLKVRYSHLSKMEVRIGQMVQQGDKIGEVGSTGTSTGPHLHYEVLVNDIFINPMKFRYR